MDCCGLSVRRRGFLGNAASASDERKEDDVLVLDVFSFFLSFVS